ncbi:class F sortase [Geodermatophilus sp. URMC 64]
MRRLSRSHRRAAALAAAALLAVAGAVLVVVGLSGGVERAPVAAVAAAPPAATTAPAPSAEQPSAPPPTPVARYTPSSEIHVVIPAVGLDLPLLPLSPEDGVIDPPLLTAGYWIEPYGAPVAAPEQSDNTLYLAAHAAGRGSDGFDPLLAGHRRSTLESGDVIEVRTPGGAVRYTVERTERYAKDALPGAAEVWAAEPGRLVLITCFQRAGGPAATENLVVFAHS